MNFSDVNKFMKNFGSKFSTLELRSLELVYRWDLPKNDVAFCKKAQTQRDHSVSQGGGNHKHQPFQFKALGVDGDLKEFHQTEAKHISNADIEVI